MQFITRPLIDWPRPVTKPRRHGDYQATYDKTLRELERELAHLGVTGDVVLQLDMPETFIRRDGLPYADERPNTPRVAISFTGRYGAMVYRCDVHHDWKENVRAIVLGLQRLRLVADTGVTSQGEQYTGFRALPPGIPMPAAVMTVEDAARAVASAAVPFLNLITDVVLRERARSAGTVGVINDKEVFQAIYRLAAKQLHPDAGGASDAWHRLQDAAEILKKHHKIA
jgi:hypothetical protein